VAVCPAACLRPIPACATWPLNRRAGIFVLKGYLWQATALKYKLQVGTEILHLRKRERSELTAFVEFLFHTVKYCAESISIRFWPFRSAFGDEGSKLCRDYDVSHGVCVYYCRTYYKDVRVCVGGKQWRKCATRDYVFSTRRTQRQKMRFRVQQSLLECREGIA
jgi:hypothetical protein